MHYPFFVRLIAIIPIIVKSRNNMEWNKLVWKRVFLQDIAWFLNVLNIKSWLVSTSNTHEYGSMQVRITNHKKWHVRQFILAKLQRNRHKHKKDDPWKENTPIQNKEHAATPRNKKNSNQHTSNLDDQLLSQFSLHETLVELMGLRNCTAVFCRFFRAQSLGAHGGCVLYCLQGKWVCEIEKCGY